tara:strand:- start:120 stop:545 length:426 start_codon:yes stop_codon:yes gene_type:complete
MKYENKSYEVAQNLVGKVLKINNQKVQVIETEAFEGGKQTPQRACMRYAPGQIGLLNYRGSKFVNIGTEAAGFPSCVLLRAVKIEDELIEGPGKVGKALNAESLEFLVLGKDIRVTGRTKPCEFYRTEVSSNSLGRYRLIE